MKRSEQTLSLIYFLSDLLALNSVLIAILSFYQSGFSLRYEAWSLFYLSLIWIVCASLNKVYQLHHHSSFTLRSKNYLKSHFAFVGVVSTGYMLFSLPNYFKTIMIIFTISFPLVNLCVNYISFIALRKLRAQGKNARKTLIVGAGKAGLKVFNHFQSNPDLGYKVLGFLDDNPDQSLQDHMLGNLYDLENVLKSQPVDEVIIAISTSHKNEIQSIIDTTDYFGVRLRLIPDYNRIIGNNYSMTRIGELPIINVREVSLDMLFHATLKRIFDFLFSVGVLILLSPVFLLLAVAIKKESKGPVFYCPIRIGRNGKKFKVFKFRSMYVGDPALGGTKSTQKDDPRVTNVGRIIRKYSLDELPQFINVLFGEMSVVGPRPHRAFLNDAMQREVENYMIRHYLKPGISGWAQVNGWRGPTDTEEQRNQRTMHDLWYLENWSLVLDLKIIYKTVFSEKTHEVAF